MNTRENALLTLEYDFISAKITQSQVEQIISKAGFKPKDYHYQPRVDKDGFVVRGAVPMSINRLENAAKSLALKVDIISAAGAVMDTPVRDTGYNITVNMSMATVNALTEGNYQFYGFKAVRSAMGGGVPVVWFASTDYSTQTQLAWTEDYTAYTSSASQIEGGTITASFTAPIDLYQTLDIASRDGTGTVAQGGTDGAISINNTSGTSFTCGIGQVVQGANSVMCAFPLFGIGLDVIMPIEKVLLTFSSTAASNGSVVEQAYAPSLLIDMTGAPNNSRTVSYDINQGWSFDGIDWATQIAANEEIVPLLVVNPNFDPS